MNHSTFHIRGYWKWKWEIRKAWNENWTVEWVPHFYNKSQLSAWLLFLYPLTSVVLWKNELKKSLFSINSQSRNFIITFLKILLKVFKFIKKQYHQIFDYFLWNLYDIQRLLKTFLEAFIINNLWRLSWESTKCFNLILHLNR